MTIPHFKIKAFWILFLLVSSKLLAQNNSFKLYAGYSSTDNFNGCYTNGDTLTTAFLQEEHSAISLLLNGKDVWKKQGDMFLSSYEISIYYDNKPILNKSASSWVASKSRMIGLLPKMPDKIVIDKIKGTAIIENKKVEIDIPSVTFYRANYTNKKCYEIASKKPSVKGVFSPKIGEKIILNNIFFEIDKSELLPTSQEELNKLANYLLQNVNTLIEISGYTDNKGNEEKNQILSQNRAKAVANYLISKNIIKERISYKGYGSSKPIAANDTEENRQKNRRVEFVINKKQ
jgi:outer membrane protein OmpA-like peptidoglycan-associated protein